MGASLLMASAVAGCVSRTFVHPLDTIRSRLMVSTSKSATFRSITRDLVQSDGLRGLYRGFGVSVVMQAPAVATFLTTYDWAKARLSQHGSLSTTSPIVHLASGLVAETVSAVFWVPMEVVKQRAQVRRGAINAATSSVIVRDLLVREGPRALFKGYGLTVGVFGPYSMLYFMGYEKLKSKAACLVYNDSSATNKLPTPFVAGCAASAGAVAAACTTPLDVIKTRLQTQGDMHVGDVGHSARHNAYRGTLHAARSIAIHDGINGFFRGISARVLWIMPNTAITMSVFEFLKSYFNLSA